MFVPIDDVVVRGRVENGLLVPDHTHGSTV